MNDEADYQKERAARLWDDISEAAWLEATKDALRRCYNTRDDVGFEIGLDAVAKELGALRAVFNAACTLADAFAQMPRAALPGSPARQLFDAVKAAREGR